MVAYIRGNRGRHEMLNINIHDGATRARTIATVADMDAARAFLEDFCAKCRFPAEIIDFEVDGDCADAAILSGNNIKTFAIEAVRAA
jgi:hypothetical protein